MTEYDYSPDAIERFRAKMDGVGQWARQQSAFAPKYTNPFLPQDQVSSRPRPSSRQNSSPSPLRHDRPEPSRSQTLPAPAPPGVGAAYGQGSTSRTYAYAQQGESRAPHPSSSRDHHRSGSQPPDARYPYPVPPAAPVPHLVSKQASIMAYLPPAPPGSRQRIINYSPGQPVVLPRPRPGETYVIVPPKGGGVRTLVADQSSSNTNSRSSSRHSHSQSSGSSSSKPLKKSSDPLYKRLLTNLTPNIEWGDGSRSGRPTSRTRREGSQRRSESR